jgi:hypothetical protein
MQVEVLPAAPICWLQVAGLIARAGAFQPATFNRQLATLAMPGGVKVARRSVKPFGVGASPTLAANQ